MLFNNGRHYHIEVLSKTIRMEVLIIEDEKEADEKYEELIRKIQNATASNITFHGSANAAFSSGDYIIKYSCIATCLKDLEEV